MIYLFCEIFTCTIQDENLDFVPPYDDKTAGEMLAHKSLLDDMFCGNKIRKYHRIRNKNFFIYNVTHVSRPQTLKDGKDTIYNSNVFILKKIERIRH